MAKNISGGDVLLGLAIFAGKVVEAACDMPQTVFIPRGTNIGFSNPVEARKYAEKYISSTTTTVAVCNPPLVEETRTPGLYGDTITRRYADGSIVTETPGIFGTTVRKSGFTPAAQTAVVRTAVVVPIDRVTKKPSQLQGGKVYNSLLEWERGW
jgi:hypothetical protein